MHDSSAHRPGDCIRRVHQDRLRLTIDQACPGLTPGVLCFQCDAEGFVIANFVLARNGYNGRSNNDTISNSLLRKMVEKMLTSPIRIPHEQMILAFGAKSSASNEDINGTQQQSWTLLKKGSKMAFKRFETWSPTTPTRAGEYASLVITIVLILARELEVERLAGLEEQMRNRELE